MLFEGSRALGVAERLSAPVRLPDGSVWVCALTGEQPNPRRHVADAARFAAERYIMPVRRLRRPAHREIRGAPFTAGQVQIIELLSPGRTLRQAADSPGTLPSTV